MRDSNSMYHGDRHQQRGLKSPAATNAKRSTRTNNNNNSLVTTKGTTTTRNGRAPIVPKSSIRWSSHSGSAKVTTAGLILILLTRENTAPEIEPSPAEVHHCSGSLSSPARRHLSTEPPSPQTRNTHRRDVNERAFLLEVVVNVGVLSGVCSFVTVCREARFRRVNIRRGRHGNPFAPACGGQMKRRPTTKRQHTHTHTHTHKHTCTQVRGEINIAAAAATGGARKQNPNLSRQHGHDNHNISPGGKRPRRSTVPAPPISS